MAWIHYVTVAAYIPAYMWKGETGLLLTLFLGVAVCMAIAATTRDPSTTDLLATLLPNIYPTYPLIAFSMLVSSPAPHWKLTIWLMLATSVGCDIFAMMVGKYFGKHKLSPRLAPTRPSRAPLAAFSGRCWAALLVYLVCLWQQTPVPVWHFAILGVVGGVATQVGDIVASYIKRFCSVKDYGTLFPGHGGLLDRIDGILFNAIAYCIYAMFFLL